MTNNAISIKINRVFKTPRHIEKGLMFLKNIPKNSGALFCMPQTKIHKFWMKNTYVSLDLIFLDENYKVVGFIENAKPLDLSLLHVNYPSKYVIEIRSGFAKETNLRVGNIVKLVYTKNPSKKKSVTSRNKSLTAKNNRF
jgi:uncharacterized membrane protein (UPF0127 family)